MKNDLVEVESKEEADCRVTLDIQSSPTLVEQAYQEALQQVGKAVSIPGFRKGRAPENLLIQHHKTRVEEEWKDAIAQKSLTEALKLLDLPLATRDCEAKVQSFSKDEGAKVLCAVERAAKIPEISPDAIQIEAKEVPPTTDEDVEEHIHRMRLLSAKLEEVKDREAQEGDFVSLSLNIEGVDRSQFYRMELSDERMPAWLKGSVLGVQVGESRTTTSEWDAKLHTIPKERFSPSEVTLKLERIESGTLPEVNEEFAQTHKEESLEALRKNVKRYLSDRERQQVVEGLSKEVENQLLDQYPFDVPGSLVHQELRHRAPNRLRGHVQNPQDQEEIDGCWKEIKEPLQEECRRHWRLYFLLSKFLDQQKIQPSQHELQILYLTEQAKPPLERVICPSLEEEQYTQRQLIALWAIGRGLNLLVQSKLPQLFS